MYDYGYFNNYAVYDSMYPDVIELENVNVPVAIFYSEYDLIGTEKDNLRLKKMLGKNVVHFEQLLNEDHISVVRGRDMSYFSKVIAVLSKF